jgi:hypothetical protein
LQNGFKATPPITINTTSVKMRFQLITYLLVATAMKAVARPRGPTSEDIMEALAKRQQTAADGDQIDTSQSVLPDLEDPNEDNTRMIGDLKQGATTPVGQSIKNILLRTESAEGSNSRYTPPGLPGSARCKADTCCIWSYISAAMTLKFTGLTLRCNDMARAAIRLGFHDAGTWSSSLAANGQDFGGADGSIVLSGTEVNRAENNGLQDIIKQMAAWQKQYGKYGVSMADLIQYGAAHAVVTCPLGPRIRSFVGRKDSKQAAQDNLLPDARASADSLIALFEDKTISGHELAALLGAHSTSKQFFFDTTKSGAPQDGTPGVWDVRFYNQTLETTGVPKKVFRLPSDVALAQHPSMSNEWTKFRQPNNVGQKHWNEDYATAYTRLSLLGVNNINNLTECTKTLPAPRPDFFGALTLYLDG